MSPVNPTLCVAFDTDDCFSSAKCKGLIWEYSYTKQPASHKKYTPAYKVSPMEYYIYKIGGAVTKVPENNIRGVQLPGYSRVPRVPANRPVVTLPIQ